MKDDTVSRGNATLADVAQRAGVSKSTVSLALRSDPRVAEKTRKRVLQAVAALNYRPNPVLSSLSAYRWLKDQPNRCGLAYITWSPQSRWTFSERSYFMGASRAAHARGYHLDPLSVSAYPSLEALERVMKHRSIRGVILGPVLSRSHDFSLTWSRYTGIACGLGFASFPYDLVMPDVFSSLRTAITEVIHKGYRRLGLALLFKDLSFNDQYRLAAALLEQELQRSQPHLSINILNAHFDDIPALLQWVDSGDFDVILGLDDHIYEALIDHQLSIPRDIAFASLHKRHDTDHIAGIDCDRETVGDTALKLLDSELRANLAGPSSRRIIHMVGSLWYNGRTLPTKP